MERDPMPDEPAANDDPKLTDAAISLTDLAALSGIDEDTLLRRLAGILDRRAEVSR
jgi:hypothetical protein